MYQTSSQILSVCKCLWLVILPDPDLVDEAEFTAGNYWLEIKLHN